MMKEPLSKITLTSSDSSRSERPALFASKVNATALFVFAGRLRASDVGNLSVLTTLGAVLIGLRAGSEMPYITTDGSRVSDAPPLRRSNGGRSSGY